MPLYEYSCKTCGIIEVRQGINDEPLKKCPACKSKVERLISVTANPQFKGSGFYQTDYKKK
jgi:putative FmdB family regulatory protein